MKLPSASVLYILAAVSLLLATAVAQLPWLEEKSAPVYAAIAEFTFMLSLIGPWLLLVRQGHYKAGILIFLLAIPQAYWLYLHVPTGKPAAFLVVPFTLIPSLLYYAYLHVKKPSLLDDTTRSLMPLAVFMSAMFLCVASFLRVTVIIQPVLDQTIAAFQAQIGLGGFETTVRSWFPFKADHTLLLTLCYMTILPASIFMLLALREKAARIYFASWVIPTVIGYFSYWLIPAVGPTVASQYFPGILSNPSDDIYLYANGLTEIRNAIPSLHVVWALLLVFFARTLSLPVFCFVAFYSSANIVVTISSGGHWVSDIVASLPLTAMALYLASKCDPAFTLSRRDDLGGLVATLGLIGIVVGLRFYPDFIVAQAQACTAFILTIAACSLYLCWRWTPPGRY